MTDLRRSAIDKAIDAMRTTQRLFDLSDNHLLMVACRELDSAGGWLPIESAPKDTRLLLHESEYVTEGYWDQDPEDEAGQCWRDAARERIRPTEWMPLPDPPERS